MASHRKRRISEMTGEEPSDSDSLLRRIRDMWQFANLAQWIYLFGKVAKIPESVDIEELEAECLKPNSTCLLDIGLCLLKILSSYRDLTSQNFDKFTCRQYISKDPDHNPFGSDENPRSFSDFDVFSKIRVLQQMTQWTMLKPEKIRDKMEEQKDMDQTQWRIEPYGWDSKDRTYYVLDDNRVYRLSEAPPIPVEVRKKKKPKQKSAFRPGNRASKRRRVAEPAASPEDAAEVDENDDTIITIAENEDDTLDGMKWECVAISLQQVKDLIQSLNSKKDENEKTLRAQIEDHLLPILERQEAARQRREAQRAKELLSLAMMANAKRSSRLANKQEQRRLEDQSKEEEMKRQAEERALRRQEEIRRKLEKEREKRLKSRETRLKERDTRRAEHEARLNRLTDPTNPAGRSERALRAEIERNKRALEELDDEDDWLFDCVCGVYGQIDDGTHCVACEKCNVWQHSKCLDISEEEAERPEFRFVCSTCQRKEDEANRPRPTIKLKVNRPSAGNDAIPPTPSEPATSPTTEPPRGTLSLLGDQAVADASHKPTDETPPAVPVLLSHPTPPASLELPSGGDSQSIAEPNSGNAPSPHVPSQDGTNGKPTGDTLRSADGHIPPTNQRTEPAQVIEKSSGIELLPNPVSLVVAHGSIIPNGNTTSPSKSSGLSPTTLTTLSGQQLPIPKGRADHSELDSRSPDTGKPFVTPKLRGLGNSTLPPSSGGISPVKHSTPLSQERRLSLSGAITLNATPTSSIFPPAATLSPSPHQQILTPPVKGGEPAKQESLHS